MAAQEAPPRLAATVVRDPTTWSGSDAQGELLFAGANALAGGLTAGVGRALRGGSFWPAFLEGTAGGTLAWAGRRLGAERWDGAGLVGRGVAAVGASVVRNAAAGTPPLAHLTVPLGPLELDVRPGKPTPLRARLNAWSTAWLARGLTDAEYRLDAAASLSRGVPVFRRVAGAPLPDGRTRVGSCIGAAVFLENVGVVDEGTVLVHEWSHVLQADFLDLTMGAPFEDGALRRLPGGDLLGRWVRPGVAVPLLRSGLGLVLPGDHGQAVLEVEAAFLESR